MGRYTYDIQMYIDAIGEIDWVLSFKLQHYDLKICEKLWRRNWLLWPTCVSNKFSLCDVCEAWHYSTKELCVTFKNVIFVKCTYKNLKN